MEKLRINYYPLLSTLVYNETDTDIPGIKDNWFRHYSHYLNTTVIYQRYQPYPTPVADPGGCIGFHGNPLFISDKLFVYLLTCLITVIKNILCTVKQPFLIN